MKKYFLLLVACSLLLVPCAFTQNVGIGTSNPLNKLHVAGGFRLDTLTGVGGNGLLWHNGNGVVYGIKFSGNVSDVLRGDGTFGTGGAGLTGWSLSGNSGTNPANNFIGTTDNQPLQFRLNNSWAGTFNHITNNYGLGMGALQFNTTGTQNVGFGRWALLSNTTGSYNTTIGHDALSRNTTGSSNTAVGNWALLLNTIGSRNTAIGDNALSRNISGIDNVASGYWSLLSNTTGIANSAFGSTAMFANTTGYENSAFGFVSLNRNETGVYNNAFGSGSLFSNTSGIRNNGFGVSALSANTTGSFNTAMGFDALKDNVTGSGNIAIGDVAMLFNQSGSNNIAIGIQALFHNTTGYSNVAIGPNALFNNTISSNLVAVGDSALYNSNGFDTYNTAVGSKALYGNINNGSGSFNTAIGSQALQKNYAYSNTAFGFAALYNNIQGFENTGIGTGALSQNISGTGNVALGHDAGIYPTCSSCSNNIMIGYQTYSTGSGNIVIGFKAGVRNGGTNAIAIGNEIQPTINEISIGNSSHTAFFAQGIFNAQTSNAPNLYITSNGQIMRVTSSARYKEDITDLEINTSNIYNLRPVSYTSKNDKSRHFGLIAEEVAQTIPELAEYSREKDVIKGSISEKLIPDAVQYPMLSVLLLKEVQKHEKEINAKQKLIDDQNKKIVELQANDEKQQKQIDELLKRIEALEKK